MIHTVLDAVLVDVGGTLVEEAPSTTPTDQLVVRLLPRVADDLAELAAAVPVAAVTNTAVLGEAEVRELLDAGGIGRHLSAIVTSADVGRAKPDPAPLLVALDRLAHLGCVDRDRILVVGNDPVDAAAAAAAGLPYVAVGPDGLRAAVDGWIAARAGARFDEAAARVAAPDPAAAAAAAAHHDRLTKPRGALGALEALGVRLAGMAGACPPPVPEPAAVAVFAGDHGVLAEGVTPWPQEVTAQMVQNFLAGGAAVNVLARQAGARVVVVDVGVAGPLPTAPGLLARRIRAGTANLAAGAAMTVTEAKLALDVGVEAADRAVADGARCLVTGDMGIGNTTPSAALVAALTGRAAADVTGRGTGIDDEMLARKTAVVDGAARRVAGMAPLDVLAEVGGLEIAALAGFVVGGAAHRVPVMVDGVIALAGLLVAESLCPGTAAWCIAGHRSVEPGAVAVLDHLGLDPLLDLGLRLGEGTGALLALPLVQAAARVLGEMATFDGAGVTDNER